MQKRTFIVARQVALAFVAMLLSTVAFAQTMSIKGKVVDNLGDAIIGVNVIEKGTTNGTLTDANGNFNLKVNEGATLSFSFIGYATQEIVVGNQTTIDVVLEEETAMLEDLVVVGYGVQKKSVVTAAISKVGGDDLNLTKPSRIEDALKGKVSGVQITQSSGQPNSDSKVRIRGIGSTTNSDPLYIVDGMPVGGGINYLNPTDIESVEILKDAASAAIYGARAANGVVLVTTKNGKSGKTQINYDFSFGWQNPWKKREVLNAKEYMTIMNEMQVNDGNAPQYSAEEIANYEGDGTDWQDEVFNYNAPVQQHQVSIKGGGERGTFFLSAGYFKQEGIVGGNYGKSNYERFSARTNNTYTVYEEKLRNFLNKLTVGVNLGYTRDHSTGVETNSEYGSPLGSALMLSPLVSVYASEEDAKAILESYPTAITDGNNVFSLPPAGFQEITNPVAFLSSPDVSKNNSDKIVGNFYAELDILPGLKFRTSYGVDLAFWGNDGYRYPYYLSNMRKSEGSSVWSSMNRGMTYQVENYLSYNSKFSDVHNLSVVLGQSAQRYKYRNVGGSDVDLLDYNPTHANIDFAIAPETSSSVYGGTGNYTHVSLASYFGRISYDYAERYMVQFTIRRDGSSHFGPNNKWGVFPSVSVGWNITNESFIENIKPSWFDYAKLRFSWGQNGNEAIGEFRYLSLMNGGQNYYFGGGDDIKNKSYVGTMVYGNSPGALGNEDIKWETSSQTDIGLNLLFLGSRLNFDVDYYQKKTKDMLADIPIPSYVGQSAPMGNRGKMENWGLEFELGWKDIIGEVSYHVGANFSYAKNKLTDIGTASGEANYESAGASGVGEYVHAKNGEVWPYFYGYKTAGLFQNKDEVNSYVNSNGELLQEKALPGDVRFVDVNGDGKINDEDRTKIGKGMPDWTYGFNLGAEWKGFDLQLNWQGTIGNDVFDFAQRGDVPGANRPAWILDRWMGEGTSNKIPRMTGVNANGNWQSSDLYIKDGSYLRLKTAQLGYTLPKHITQVVSIQKFRVYVAAENLFTFTGYDGFDPELASGGYTTIGVDKGIYPQARTISVGANITF